MRGRRVRVMDINVLDCESENHACKSIFASDDEMDIGKVFTDLWIQIINEKENKINNCVQTDIMI